MSKINRGIWCPRRAAGFVKEGQCSRRKGPGKGLSPAAAHAPRWGPGARGGGLSSGFVYLLAHGARRGWSARHPGPTAVSRVRISSGQRVRQLWWRGLPLCSLPGPTRTPGCMHGEETHKDTSVHARGRDRSPEERRARQITAAVMRLHSCQVCLITRRQTCLFQRPSSHTPSGAWWRATLKDGVMMMIRGGGSRLVTILKLSFNENYINILYECLSVNLAVHYILKTTKIKMFRYVLMSFLNGIKKHTLELYLIYIFKLQY